MLSVGDEPIRGYRLQKFLGRGAFGEVWKATSPGGTFVAMKFLDLSGKQGWKEFHALERIKQIRHPHILPIHALWLLDADGQVLEYDAQTTSRSASSSGGDARGTLGPITGTLGPVDYAPPSSSPASRPSPVPGPQNEPRRLVVAIGLADETLKDRLETCQREGRNGIPVDELLPYMVDAARGLDFLNEQRHELDGHRVALQHCDVKPANLLVMGGSVILGDFGLVSILSNQGVAVTATGMVGSLAYMSPECIRKKPGGGSDQYSLAVTYYELRTGRLPFAAEDPLSVAEAHVRGKLDLSGLPAAEERVLRRATQIKGSARYATSQEMVEALRQAVMPPVRPRNTLVRWITSTGILAASLAGVLWYYQFGPGKQEAGGGGGGGSGGSSNNGQGNGGQLTHQGTDANPTGNGNGSAVTTPQVTDEERLTELAQALREFDLERGKTIFRQLSPAGQEQARVVNSRRLDLAPNRLKGLAINQQGTKLVALSTTGPDATAVQTWNLDALHTTGTAEPSEPRQLQLVDPVMCSGNRVCAIVGNRKSADTLKKVTALVVVDLDSGQMQEVEFDYQLISPYVTLSDQENAVLLTGSAAGQTRVRCWRLTTPAAEPSPQASATDDGASETNLTDTGNAQPTGGSLELSEVGSELTLARMRFPKCLEFAANGQVAYIGGESKQRAGVLYGVSLDRWDEAAQEDYAALLDTEFKITKLAWATPESLVVTSTENASDPSRVQIVDVATGTTRGELLKVPGSVQSLTTFNSPAESWIACGSVQGSVAVWQLPSAGGANSAPTSTDGESSTVDGVSIEAAGETSATADDPSGNAELTAASGSGGTNVPPRFEMLGQYNEAISLIALCPNSPGLLVVCSVPKQRSGSSATVLDLLQIAETNQPRLTLEVGEGANSLAMAGSWIAVGLSPRSTANGPRDAIMVYDLTRLRLLQELQQTPVLLGPTANPASQTAHRWH